MPTHFDFSKLSLREKYYFITALVAPRPIAWVSTLNDNQTANLAPFSFFNAVSSDPPCLAFSIVTKKDGAPKDTLVNIRRTGEFVINTADAENLLAINASSEELAYGESEIKKLGLTIRASQVVQAPQIANAFASFECRLKQMVELGDPTHAGSCHLIIGEVIALTFRDSPPTPGNLSYTDSMYQPLSRLGEDYWGDLEKTFRLTRP